MSEVTLAQIDAMVEALPLPDQRRLIQRIEQRLSSGQDYFARAEAFIKGCLENPVHVIAPAELYDIGLMDSGVEMAAIRDERGDQLL